MITGYEIVPELVSPMVMQADRKQRDRETER